MYYVAFSSVKMIPYNGNRKKKFTQAVSKIAVLQKGGKWVVIYKNVGKLSGKVAYMEEEMKVGRSSQLCQLIYICGQYAHITPLVVCAKASVCMVGSVVWQKLCEVWVSFALHCAHLTVLNCAHIKTLPFSLTEKWLWKIHSHLSWIYMKMKIMSNSWYIHLWIIHPAAHSYFLLLLLLIMCL